MATASVPAAAGTVSSAERTDRSVDREAAPSRNGASTRPAAPIPFDQIGSVAARRYSGDGLSVQLTPEGARLHSTFQKLEADVTAEGLSITSTGVDAGRLRLRADSLRRGDTALFLPREGIVTTEKDVVRFARPGLVEEVSTSVDGVRQDFVLSERPSGEGPLLVELELRGAKAKASAAGATLTLGEPADGGRALTYGRLRVNDAAGKDVVAALEVLADNRLAVRVDDADAVYPLRIDPTFSDADWVSLNAGIPGANGQVREVATDASGNVYIGGDFTFVGSVAATRIAKWDGSAWTPLGSGLNNEVWAIAVSGTDVYAGGYFTTAGGIAVNRVAKWNGSTWSALGTGMNNIVLALAISGSDVYAAGDFTTAGGTSASRIARWNGSTWSALGTGLSESVRALAVSGTNVYAGGLFTNAGGTLVNYVAQWNGSAWAALGPGMNNFVYALAVSGTDVYAAGDFTTAGGNGASRVAKWNGSSWAALGAGVSGRVWALAAAGTDIYAGGDFTAAGGNAANHVAKWNGSTWASLDTGTNAWVRGLAVSGTDIFVGGQFTGAGATGANSIAKWDGSAWATLGTGVNSTVLAVAVSGTDLYAGGFFVMAGSVNARYVAKWDGNTWSAIGAGMDNAVYTLAVSGSDVYAGGAFTNAGGTSANYIAKWDGSTWSALGAGLNSAVNVLVVSGTDLYAGGSFTTAGGAAANRVAKWDGAAWTALGTGTNDAVLALAASGGSLYAGGQFTTAGGSSANSIATWDGTTWTALGTGLTGGGGRGPFSEGVNAIAVNGTDVYAAGEFDAAGGISANRIAKWDGSTWTALGTGVSGQVWALAVSGTDIYAGGDFSTAGGFPANRIAKWNGSTWSALGTGVVGSIRAMVVSDSDLYVAGNFTTAGTTVSPYIVKAHVGNHAPVASAGADQSVAATSADGATVTLDGSASADADASSGDSLVLYEWDLDDNGVYDVTGSGPSVPVPFGASTIRLRVTDSVGGTGTDTVSVTVTDQFTISITTPAVAATYTVGQAVTAAFTCSDTANIIQSCVGTVPNGSNVDTSTAGSHDFTVTATNTRGESSARTVSYSVSAAATTTVVSFGTGPYAYRGTAFTATATVTGGGLNQAIPVTYGGDCLNVTGANGCTASASFAGDANHLASSSTVEITITPAAALVALSDLTQTQTGSPLTPTATTVPAGLAITWTNAPQTNAGTYGVTATIANPNYSGSASGTFVISNPVPLAVTVLSPNGGERVFANVPETITWTSTSATGFDVALSRNGGAAYTNIAGCIGLPGTATSCSWTPTGPATTTALIRVTARGSGATTATDASDAAFAISTATPSVTVTWPNTAQAMVIGTTRTLTWNHNLGAGSFVRVELTRDDGVTWETVAASVPNTTATNGTMPWVVTGPATTSARMRVTSLDSPATDVSNALSSIVLPVVTVLTPNNNANWAIDALQTITWSHNVGLGYSVRLERSNDAGLTWQLIAASAPNTAATRGTFDYLVTGPVTSTARIRVILNDPSQAQDVSDVDFRVASSVRVTAPNTAVTWVAGTQRSVTWSHTAGLSALFDVAISPDNGATWQPLASGVTAASATTGSATVTLPMVVTSQALIRVSPAGVPANGDVSDVPFTLAAPTVSVTAPNTIVNWSQGSTRTIRWTHNLGVGSTMRVDVSRDSGATWTTIAASVSNTANTSGSYSWVVTGPATTTARIRVAWTADGAVQDVSDIDFKIP